LRNFHLPYIRWLAEQGCEVTTLADEKELLPFAAGTECAPVTKSLGSPQNVIAIAAVRKLLLRTKFDVAVTNTTLAGAVVRAAVLAIKKSCRPRVLHICHGYPFNCDDGLRKRLYLPPERICMPVTDLLVVMNREDERIAKKCRLARQIAFVHGMGVDGSRFQHGEAAERLSSFTFVCAAEFSARKNHELLIRAFAKAAPKMPGAMLALAGDGATLKMCRRLAADVGIAERVRFLGHVGDMPSLFPKCDAAVSASRYEGLPFNIVEAMLCGLPVLASDIKGHRDLLDGTAGGVLAGDGDLADKLVAVYSMGRRRVAYPNAALYTLPNVRREWESVYSNFHMIGQ
jgi:glycosyltransferase EpsD